MGRKGCCLFTLMFLLSLLPAANAGKFISKTQNFSIEPSEDWIQLPLNFQREVVSYEKKGTVATFHISVQELDGAKMTRELKWEDLFSPEFGSIDIHTQGETIIGGERARFCLYTLKPGAFKMKMEGKLPAKYMNCVLVRDHKLFSITFLDAEEGFSLNYPAFMTALRTLQFNPPLQTVPEKTP